jgi:non-haem Fe2+, alpha-ketoglutarate-dependent halogenase
MNLSMTNPTSQPQQKLDLTDEELARFHESGYAGPFTLWQPEEMKAIWSTVRRRLFDRSRAAYPLEGAVSGGNNIANYDRHLDVPYLGEHICRPEIVHRVRSILGDDVICWRTEFFPKYPGDEGTDWHQADTFANASGRPQIIWPESSEFGGTITVWSAFTDATEKTACLRFIPGTHRTHYYNETKGMKYNPEKNSNVVKDGTRRGFFGYDYRELQIDPNWKPDESKAVSIEMKAGQFVIFWSMLMHASCAHAGETNDMRMGFVARYVPTRVRVYPDTEWVEEYGGAIPLTNYGAVLVNGRDAYGHNKIRTTNMRGAPFKRWD